MGDHVFISYSREDQDFVIKLANNLKSHGIPIWLDQWNNTPGVTYPQATEKALFDCTCLLVVLSPSSVKSDWVQSECHAALDEGKKVVPILYQPCRIPIRLKLIQYIDFTSISPDDEKSLEQVLRALGKGREQELSDWVKKGSDLETLGRYDEAIQAYDKAIELDSHASKGQNLVWYLKGEILMKSHKFEEALQAFDEALKINPKSSQYWQKKGAALYNTGKYNEAFKALDKAIELDPDNINAWDDKVTGLRNLRRIKEADAVLGELKKRFPPSRRKMYP